ncbi:hypothetical protein NDU88_006894 [Pleurodeles waltl]|uniref:Reverse transcriptase zinc-binding domain-containing protein n=1 Tax=Pleurodeles waltl TaxID=8319 RepID=A0AAV7MGA3_PLEWA|nr:hypothetical protein NDU88_006894 [Pleurodeles waltl]
MQDNNGVMVFEKLPQETTPIKKEVAKWYWRMVQGNEKDFTVPEELWKRDSPILNFTYFWQVFMFPYINLFNLLHSEKYHLFTQGLLDTKKLASLGKQLVKCCPKCGLELADDPHMFAHCLVIQPFRHDLGKTLSEMLSKAKVSLELVISGFSLEKGQ